VAAVCNRRVNLTPGVADAIRRHVPAAVWQKSAYPNARHGPRAIKGTIRAGPAVQPYLKKKATLPEEAWLGEGLM
jgi:hypothetical protein